MTSVSPAQRPYRTTSRPRTPLDARPVLTRRWDQQRPNVRGYRGRPSLPRGGSATPGERSGGAPEGHRPPAVDEATGRVAERSPGGAEGEKRVTR